MAGPDVTPYLKDMSDPEPKARRAIPPVSARRRAEQKARDECRREVLFRAGGRCQYAPLFPDVPCGWLPDRYQLEVDEIRGGSWRSTEHTNPDRCRAACPVHHDIKTATKDQDLVERIEALPC